MKLSKKIFTTLRDKIINLEYPPETLLSEEALCKEYQVSRTPLREALHQLAEMDLIQSIPRYGTIVKPVNVNEIRNAYEVKAHLDYLAGFLAAQRITQQYLERLRQLLIDYEKAYQAGDEGAEKDVHFHEVMYEATQNGTLEQTLKKLTSQCLRYCRLFIPDLLDTSQSISELNEIFQALEARDTERTALLCRQHTKFFLDRIRESTT